MSDTATLSSGHSYQRVVIDANLRRMGGKIKRLKGIERLVVFDHDICQEYVPGGDWHRRYVPVLKYLGAARTIVSSAYLATYLRGHGLDAVFIPKAFDDTVIRDLERPRDIEAAFVGRLNHKVYRERKRLLHSASAHDGLQLLRSEPGELYNDLLNRIRIFVSADIGFNEYMIKNFEALAAGCTLLAWRQPNSEQQGTGLREGQHMLLFGSEEELRDKLREMQENPQRAGELAQAGQAFVRMQHSWRHRVAPMIDALQAPLLKVPTPNLKEKLKMLRL